MGTVYALQRKIIRMPVPEVSDRDVRHCKDIAG
jgi:hypothetical protein